MTATRHDWVHTFKTTLAGDAERVFAALTTPEALTRWFAEHVQVEPYEGGAFRFWGRHSYGTSDAADATQRFMRFERPTSLGFTWLFEGAPSEVTLTATPAEPGNDGARTTLEVRHGFPARLTAPWGDELVDDLWRLTLGNLDAYPRIGGHYRYGWTYKINDLDVVGGPMTILDLVPNARLVTDWLDWRGDPTRPPTRLAWLLDDVPAGTRVTLVHGGFSRVVDQSDYPFGWMHFMERLKATVETTA